MNISFFLKTRKNLVVIIHTFNPHNWEAEASKFISDKGQPGLHSKVPGELEVHKDNLSQNKQANILIN